MKTPSLSQRGAAGSGAAGFTLLELVFVMAIIALVMGMGAFSLAEFEQNRSIDVARTELTFQVRQARQVASDTGETVWVVFQKNRFGLLDSRGPDAIAWSELPDIAIRLRRVGEREWLQPELFFWEFTPRQLGEPLAVRLTGVQGADLALEFSPLSGESRLLDVAKLR
jgi:prepilin-type N-terminal cleavage/methylation domain-containing protein